MLTQLSSFHFLTVMLHPSSQILLTFIHHCKNLRESRICLYPVYFISSVFSSSLEHFLSFGYVFFCFSEVCVWRQKQKGRASVWGKIILEGNERKRWKNTEQTTAASSVLWPKNTILLISYSSRRLILSNGLFSSPSRYFSEEVVKIKTHVKGNKCSDFFVMNIFCC